MTTDYWGLTLPNADDVLHDPEAADYLFKFDGTIYCKKCGAVVASIRLHTEWHGENDRVSDPRSR